MIIKVVNKINALQKRSATEVIAHLLGLDSVWFSHPEANLHLASFLGEVEEFFGERRPGQQRKSELLRSREVGEGAAKRK
jgi:hypothetical protein